MKKKLFLFCVTFFLLLSFSLQVYAAPILSLNVSMESRDNDYTIIHYFPQTRLTTLETVDFTSLTASTRSGVDSYLESSPYTPGNYTESNTTNDESRGLVVGHDLTRVGNVAANPYTKIVAIETLYAYYENGVSKTHRQYCTGFLLGPDLIVTCAHAVYRASKGGWPVYCYVYTEMTSEDDYYSKSIACQITLHNDYYSNPNDESVRQLHDWAYIRVTDNPGTWQGWFGFSSADPANYVNESITTAGFPQNTCVMWESSGTITEKVNKHILRAAISTDNGMSGAPYFTSNHMVRAIHSREYAPLSNSDYCYSNQGVVITYELFLLLREAKEEGLDIYS